ncbi:MAG: SagB/ThcOx family dehydrogenase [Candidatus Binataceae bacterium]
MANDYIEASRVFHEVTKHSYTSVRTGAYALDWDNKPLPYKIYPEAGALVLPRDVPLSPKPALAAIAAVTPADATMPIDLAALTRLLASADGLTRTRKVGGEDYHFRAAASAGALYPNEIYVFAAEVDGLQPGLYHFSPADLKLRGLRRGDFRAPLLSAAADRATIRDARAVLVVSSIFWRSAWKYRARAFRYCFWDAGTMLANLLAAAAADSIPAYVGTAFIDAEVDLLIGADGEREGVACIVPLGVGAAPPAEAPTLSRITLETIPLSNEEVVYDDLRKIQAATRLETIDEVRAVASAMVDSSERAASADAARFVSLAPERGAALGETILHRGSTRVFSQQPIPADELATILAASSNHPPADFPRLTDTYVIVNAVEGLKSGAYFYNRTANAFELLKVGNFRAEAGYLCLEQPLGMDCSALIVYMADLERALGALGNRAYRDVHLEAGIHGGRAYLAAYALGRGATGLTFYDDDTSKFFAPHAAGKSPILMVAIGVPRSRATS